MFNEKDYDTKKYGEIRICETISQTCAKVREGRELTWLQAMKGSFMIEPQLLLTCMS